MSHVCLMYVSCMSHVCLMYVSCMYHVCIMYVSCMFSVDFREYCRYIWVMLWWKHLTLAWTIYPWSPWPPCLDAVVLFLVLVKTKASAYTCTCIYNLIFQYLTEYIFIPTNTMFSIRKIKMVISGIKLNPFLEREMVIILVLRSTKITISCSRYGDSSYHLSNAKW